MRFGNNKATTSIAILDESFIPKIPELFLSYTPERTGTGSAPYRLEFF
jgi:hypothetical protein